MPRTSRGAQLLRAAACLLLAACDRPSPTEVVSALNRIDRAVRAEPADSSEAAIIPFSLGRAAHVVATSAVEVTRGDTLAEHRALVVERVYEPPARAPQLGRRARLMAFLWRGHGREGLVIAGERFDRPLGVLPTEAEWRLHDVQGLPAPGPFASYFPAGDGMWLNDGWRATSGAARIVFRRTLDGACDLPLRAVTPADSALGMRCEPALYTVELDGEFVSDDTVVAPGGAARPWPRRSLRAGVRRQEVRGYRLVIPCDDGPAGSAAGCGHPVDARITAICRVQATYAPSIEDSLRVARRCGNRIP